MQWQDHKSNPAAQEFNVTGKKNLTKVQSWWNPSSKTYWAAKRK